MAEFSYKYNRRFEKAVKVFDETIEKAVSEEKRAFKYKPKKQVRHLAYPRKNRKRKVAPGVAKRQQRKPGKRTITKP